MPVLTVSSKGEIIIPAWLRTKYNIQPGSRVEIVDCGMGLMLVPLLENPIEELHGLLGEHKSLTQTLLTERARDKEKEEQDGEMGPG